MVGQRNLNDTEYGVFYRPFDYCGAWRRLVVDMVDVIAAFALFFLAAVGIVLVDPDFTPMEDTILPLLFVVWFAYFVGFKASPLRTLGYRLGRVKAVTLQGQPLTFWLHCVRFLFMVFGPVNFLVDLLWISTDPMRQTLRDKLAHTYVVKADATPAGEGRIVYRYYHILGWSFIFREVEPHAVEPAR